MEIAYHQSVMVKEVLQFLIHKRDGVFVDATIGDGGHAKAILEVTKPDGILIGIDKDDTALEKVRSRLSLFGNRIIFLKGSFSDIENLVRDRAGYEGVDGIVMDIGLREELVENAARGFSFKRNGPLDMRLDRKNPITAELVLNQYSESRISEILKTYGEIRNSDRLAKSIVKSRPLKTTFDLVKVIVNTFPSASLNELAPRVFQAIRIEVNNELRELEDGLLQAIDVLLPNGRLAVITYHSLEDRIVKDFFVRESKDCLCSPRFPECRCGHRRRLRILTPKPVTPSLKEIEKNRSSRSAKLRVAERI